MRGTTYANSNRFGYTHGVRSLVIHVLALTALVTTAACGASAATIATSTAEAQTATAGAWTHTPSASTTPSPSSTPSITPTPTITLTPTITPTPTFAFPSAIVNKQAHCRYGPSVAYLHAADLYPGDAGTVRGRHEYSRWHYVKFDKLDYFCWVAPSVVDVVGDVSTLYYTKPNLPTIGYNAYGPPTGVTAVRDGSQVTISWNQVHMTHDDDRGYFIEAFVCQGGFLLWWTFSYEEQFTTTYTVTDEAGCPELSSGEIYTVEKHGYSQPREIPWPPP